MSVRLSAALAVVLTVAAYVSAFPGAFQFDDHRVIVANPDVHGLGAWLASMPGIRPLTKLSYALNWTLDPAARGFVAFNVACHAMSTVMVFLLARRWIGQWGSLPEAAWERRSSAVSVTTQDPATDFAALVAALIFALHPAQTEAVTYIAGRSVSLSACLYLGAMLAWERARDREGGLVPLLVSLLLFALAVCARETAVTLPAAIVLRELASRTPWKTALLTTRWHWIVLAVVALSIVTLPGYQRLAEASFGLRGPLANLALLPSAVAYLVIRPLATLRLNIDPDVVLPAPPGWAWWVAAIVLVTVVLLGVRWLRTRPLVGFAILWFVLHLLPVHGPIARFDPVNDRQLHLALIGPALLLGAGLAALRPAPVARGIAIALLAVLGVATLARNTDYRGEVALWEATSRVSPAKARVWNNLGVAYREAGERSKARAAFERALAVDPAHYKSRENLRELE